MSELTSFITIAPSNAFMFTNSSNNDLVIYTESNSQNILFGVQSNVPGMLSITSNLLTVGGSILPFIDNMYDLGSSSKRFKDLYLSSNSLDIAGIKIQKDNATGMLKFTSNNLYQKIAVDSMQLGNSSNIVTISFNSNTNTIQFVNSTLSNGVVTSSNVSSVGGWSNTGANSLALIGSNVGIGLSTPVSLLHLQSNASNYITFTNTSNPAGVYFGLENTADTNGGNNAVIWNRSNAGIRFITSNVERMRLTSNGFLGIGTSNPIVALHIADNANTNIGMRLSASNNSIHSDLGIAYTINNYLTGSLKGDLCVRNLTACNILLGLGTNVIAMTICSNANVGIGVNNPASKLDVAGDINFTGNLKQNGLLYVGSQWSNSGCNVFLFSNVGIGKSNPSFPLDINGDLNFTGNLRQNGTIYVGSQWSNISSNVFLIGSNVGIGLSNPTSALTVAGDLEIRSNLNITNALTLRGLKILKNSNANNIGVNATSVVTSVQGYALSNNNIDLTVGATSTNYLRVMGSNTEVMRVTGNGNIGIGTTTPSSLLDVAGNAWFGSNSLNPMPRIGISACEIKFRWGGQTHYSIFNSNNTFSIQKTSTTPDHGATVGAVLIAGTTNGFVGIGHSNPASMLHVLGDAWANSFALLTNGTAALPVVSWSNDSDTGMYLAGSDQLGFSTNGTNAIFINSNQNIGIGTTSPSSLLEVSKSVANTNNQIRVINDGNYGGSEIQVGRGSGAFGISMKYCREITSTLAPTLASHHGEIFTIDGNDLLFGTASTERMRITSTGNVGIGTTSPACKLDVNGFGRIKNNSNYSSTGITQPVLYLCDNYKNRNDSFETDAYAVIRKGIWSEIGSGVDAPRVDFNLKVRTIAGEKTALTMLADTTSTRVGINTSNPQYTLDVNGDTRTSNLLPTGQVLANAADTSVLPSYTWLGDPDTGMYHPTTNTLGLTTAGTERLRIDSTGNVGIGTTTPGYKLDVNGQISGTSFISSVATGTAPFTVTSTTAVTNLNADLLDGQHGSFYQSATNINAGTLAVARGGTGVTTSTGTGSVVLSASPTFSGNVTNSTGYYMTSTTNGYFMNGNTGIGMYLDATNPPQIIVRNSAGLTGVALANGSTAWAAYSDQKLKTNIYTLSNNLDKITSLNPVSFNWIEGSSKQQFGLIAQEVSEFYPNLVYETKPKEDSDSYLMLEYTSLIAPIIGAIKELKEQISDLYKKLERIKPFKD